MHEIKNQHGKYIDDKNIREEIIFALEHDWTYTYYNEAKIEIVSDFSTDEGRVTIVCVEGL